MDTLLTFRALRFECGVKKLNEQLALSVPCVMTVAASFGAESEVLMLVDKYKRELNEIVSKFENVKDKINHSLCQESLNGHPDFQEEISEAIQVLKRGYIEIELALNKHDKTLSDLTELISKESLSSERADVEVSKLKHFNPTMQQQSQVLLCQLKEFENAGDSAVKTKFIKEMEFFLEKIIHILQSMNVECVSTHSQVECQTILPAIVSSKNLSAMHRRHSDESGVTAYTSSLSMIDQLLKENKALKNHLEKVKLQQDITSEINDGHSALKTVMEENKYLTENITAINKLYDETEKKVDKYMADNEKLKLNISVLEQKLKETDCMDLVGKLNEENREYKLQNDLLQQELESFRISKFSKYSQTCDEEIAQILQENESIKTELESTKTQLSHLETELTRIAQIKDFQFLLKSEEPPQTSDHLHNSNFLDEIRMLHQVDKILGSQTVVSNAFKGFSEVISQLYQENQSLKSQLQTELQTQRKDSSTHCLPHPQGTGSVSVDVEHSNNYHRAAIFSSRSLDSEDENGCENLVASVSSNSCEDGEENDSKGGCNSGNCRGKSKKERHCDSTAEFCQQDSLATNCVPQCNEIPQLRIDSEFERELSSPPTKDDVDVIPLSLQYLIDPRNRETEFTCKNTAAHPKEYSHKNGKVNSEGSGCLSCHHTLKVTEKHNEKSVSKDAETGPKKSSKSMEECETTVWNCSVVNGCDKRRDSEKSKKFLRDRCLTTGSIDDHINSYKNNYVSERGYYLSDRDYKEKVVKDDFYDEREFHHMLRSKETPSKTLAAFTDLSNFTSSFRTYPDYVHECPADLMERRVDSLDSCGKTCTWPCRDAATNTNSAHVSVELQRELQMEREKGRRNQQSMKKLKAEVQVLRGMLGDVKKGGKIDTNSVKQGTYNSSSTSCCSGASNSRHLLLSSAPVSPLRFDQTLAEFQRKVVDLEQKLREENSMRWALELQVNKMKYELKEKMQLEKDLDSLRCQMEKEFVSRYELEQLKRSYEIALQRAKQEAESAVRDDVSSRLHQINTVIEKQMQEQSRYEQMRSSSEAQIRQDFQDTRLKLLSELARVQNALQEKGEKELELRQKCDKLSRECDKKHDIRRKKLIEKSYSINLAPYSSLGKEKEFAPKVGVVHHRSLPSHIPAQHSVSVPAKIPDSWPSRVPMNHFLRRELEKSIRKHSSPDPGAEQSTASTSHASTDERLKILKNKYFLH